MLSYFPILSLVVFLAYGQQDLISSVLSVRDGIPGDLAVIAGNVVNKRPALGGATPQVITAPLPQATITPPSTPTPVPPETAPINPTPSVPAVPTPTIPPVSTPVTIVEAVPVTVVGVPVTLVAPQEVSIVIVDEESTEVNCTTIVEAALATPELSTLVAALQAANLVDALANSSLVATVFAPTNDAFERLFQKFNATAEQVLADPLLDSILLYHVVPNAAVFSTDLEDGAVVTTLAEQDLTIDLEDGVKIEGKGSVGNVTIPDISACEAVIHVIDEVLLPDFSLVPESTLVSVPEVETITLTLSA
eukprot:TRINITY_DN1123_c0_g1_i4.p1 TRINITY_DN1123_c0_g1~~TRINITY_DN1123_c0_g1_i4.p1  ORF type:complete len:306 (-),score=60.60 TRINITY_DN1123_c0_g1_i4:236-1153(-)